jgi:hypothetical protein
MKKLKYFLLALLLILVVDELIGVARAVLPIFWTSSTGFQARGPVTFAQLGSLYSSTNQTGVPQDNGTFGYCSDCGVAANQNCAGSGPGSFYQRVNGVWKCGILNTGVIGSVPDPLSINRIIGIGVAPSIDDFSVNHVLNVRAYGAKGDKKEVADGVMTASSATLTSATAGFTAADVGKAVVVGGAIAGGITNLAASRQVTIRSNTDPVNTHYTAATISFTAPGTISDSANGLGGFTAGDTIIVGDSVADDGMYQVLTVSAGTLTVGHALQTTISAFTNASTVTLNTTATNAVTHATVQWGTDDTASFNNAFLALPASGGAVEVPCTGSYWIDATTSLKPKSGTTFRASCHSASPATIFTGKTAVVTCSSTDSGTALDLISVSNVRIEGLTWDGNKRMFGCAGSGTNTIRSVNSVGTPNTGTSHITITDNTVTDAMTGVNILGTLNTAGTGIANDDVDVSNNRFYGIGASAVVILGNDSYSRANHNYIKRYAMAGSGSGVVLGRYGRGGQVIGNQIFGDDVLYSFCVSCHGISADFGYLVNVEANQIEGIGGMGTAGTFTSLGACIEEGFSSNSTFADNTMSDCKGMYISGTDSPRQATDAAMTNGSYTVTASTYDPVASNGNVPTGFFPGVHGYGVTVTGAGPGGQPLTSVVQRVISPTQIQLRDPAQATVSGQVLTTGAGLNHDVTFTGNIVRNVGVQAAFNGFVNYYFTRRTTADGVCVISGSHITSATAAFTNGPSNPSDLTSDVGRGINVAGCGAAGAKYYGIITAWNSATDVTVSPPIATAASGQVLNITDTFQTATDGVCNVGTTITSATIRFQNYDLQRGVTLRGAGAAGADLVTTITKLNDSTSAVVANAITTGIASGCVIQIASDYGNHRNLILTGNYANSNAGNFIPNGIGEGISFNEVLGGTITGNTLMGSYLSGVDLNLSNKILVTGNNLSGNNISSQAGHGALRINALASIGKGFWLKANQMMDNYVPGTTNEMYYLLDGVSQIDLYPLPAWIEYGTENGYIVNACKGDVTLSTGTGTFTKACVTTASACVATDVSVPANACKPGIPAAGSVVVTGTGTDVCRTVCQ